MRQSQLPDKERYIIYHLPKKFIDVAFHSCSTTFSIVSCVDRGHFCIYHDDTDAPDLCRSAPISLFLTYVRILLDSMTYVRWLVGTKHFPESKNTSQNPKHVPESKNTYQNPKHFPESKHTSKKPNTHPAHIQESKILLPDSGTCF